MEYTPVIYVHCNACDKTFDENEITDPEIGIEENERGQDVVSFVCPKCGKETTSLRFGLR
jgi:DNA-directed RNA polymerase subunit RPC12/RpoP